MHPEVAAGNRELLLDLQEGGACLGLHLHPYKLKEGKYRHDLGAYSAAERREILLGAMRPWESALGQTPCFFRAGYFSASDASFGVLDDLGFREGSLSNPRRVFPSHCSVWAGAEPYPHRAHLGFRQFKGDSDFVEVPVSGAFGRPVARGHAGERGYEWLYIPHTYDRGEVIRDVLKLFVVDNPPFGAIVTDTHNDQDYADPDHPSSRSLAFILGSIQQLRAEMALRPVGITLDVLCDQALASEV